MKIDTFLGINNVADRITLQGGEMTAATNLDISSRGKLVARRGRESLDAGGAHSVFVTPFGVLAVVDNNLNLYAADGTFLRLVYDTVGYTRVWYTLLPDGRVGFSNGLIQGLCTAAATTDWGIPRPWDAGTGIEGDVPYQVTYVRTSDGLEGPPTYGPRITTSEAIIGLPTKAGYSINVYFAPYGEVMYLAGTTSTDSFTWAGGALGAQFVGKGLDVPPVGRLLHAWNSRVLIADGSVIWATTSFNPELCNVAKDFIQMPAMVTLLYGNGDGLFVGTTDGLYFLAGQVLDQLKAQPVASGYVALGSCVEIPLSYLNEKVRPSGVLQGSLCIVEGVIHLIYGGGQIIGLTTNRYRTAATEVHATARVRDGVLQYLASPA